MKIKFSCKNCGKDCDFPIEYKNGKGLKYSKFKDIVIECNSCKSKHTLSLRYCPNEPNNILSYIVDFQYKENLFINNAFWFEETENPFTLSGYISNCYLLLGFDQDTELKEKIKKVPNEADRKILNGCFDIIKVTRNKITQHNKKSWILSSLNENDIYPLFINCANMIVKLLKKYGHNPYDMNDRRINERKIVFKEDTKN